MYSVPPPPIFQQTEHEQKDSPSPTSVPFRAVLCYYNSLPTGQGLCFSVVPGKTKTKFIDTEKRLVVSRAGGEEQEK